MRIVGGIRKGKVLKSPLDEKTRPTSDKARKALFDMLTSRLMKENKNFQSIIFLDVFAGTGAVGIEALSRGAKDAFFIENHLPAIQCLRENTKDFSNAHILSVSALCPAFTTKAVDIAFLDAPYREELWEKALLALQEKGWIDEKTLVVVEIEANEEGILPATFHLLDDRTYGRNRLLFCQYEKRK